MSIIIHFNPAPFIPSAGAVPSTPACLTKTTSKLEMVPGIEHDTDEPVMTEDDNLVVDIASSNTLYNHAIKEVHTTTHSLNSCFGLPYQDHNYGAPPPPTPPTYSPCASPARSNGLPDEDTNLSVVSTSTNTEEVVERSITRCVCGFEHDDEYMICCDRCLVWQHVDCMGLDRNNIPETYLCEKCEPRKVDRHKAKVLQARKKVAMSDSSDSEDGNKHSERRVRTRSRRKKEEEKTRNTRERMEIKRSKLRRGEKKESTSTADEEAQDAWDVEWCDKHFEDALSNQYTREVQRLALDSKGGEGRLLERMHSRNCRLVEDRLFSQVDLARDQPLIEYKGKFLLSSQFKEIHPVFSKRLFPFVLFHTVQHEDICVDASVYGNDARFVRRSCKPNTELRHLTWKGNLHLYLASTKAIFKGDEVTLPFDFTQRENLKEMVCACNTEDCLLKPNKRNGGTEACQERRRKGRRFTSSADEDSSQSSPVKPKTPPNPMVTTSPMETPDSKPFSDHETEQDASRKKMTREERKIDAIMRAFDQMEKTAKRRQQALQRIAKKSEEHPEDVIKEEEAPPSTEDEKPPQLPLTPLKKKSKRRRGSGTRRRTRTNSGGSDILSPDDLPAVLSPAVLPPPPTTPPPSPVVLKTKRSLLHEWMQEKLNKEMTYVRCTKEGPGGLQAVHMRRSSAPLRPSSGQGSAKKRWLRQAMYDDTDITPPLKKRRLMRESTSEGELPQENGFEKDLEMEPPAESDSQSSVERKTSCESDIEIKVEAEVEAPTESEETSQAVEDVNSTVPVEDVTKKEDVNSGDVNNFCISSPSSNDSSAEKKDVETPTTPKRKVSLSEYRLRMRESTAKVNLNNKLMKKSTSAPVISMTTLTETLAEQVSLAPLPLFETPTVEPSSPVQSPKKSLPKKEEVTTTTEENGSNCIEQPRENLTERLKREFGLEDVSEEPPNPSIVPMLSLPPPPPPPRPYQPSPFVQYLPPSLMRPLNAQTFAALVQQPPPSQTYYYK